MMKNDDDKQMDGIAEFFRSWPVRDIKDWEADSPELELAENEGGCWTGSESSLSSYGANTLKPLTKPQWKPQAQTCSPSSVQCPITMDSGSLLGLPVMVSVTNLTTHHIQHLLTSS